MSDADITALVAMLRHIQCEPASFDTYSMASAAERAADAIERLRSSGGASELQGRQWAVFCDTCGATWSVQHYHAGKDRCEKCRNSSGETSEEQPEAEPPEQLEDAPSFLEAELFAARTRLSTNERLVEELTASVNLWKDRCAALEQRLASSGEPSEQQDAARYRFLRGLHDPGPDDPRVHTLDQQHDPVQVRLCFGDDLDAVVDAAMRQP